MRPSPHSPSKSRPPPLSPAAQASRRRQRSSFIAGAAAGGASVALLALMFLASSRANLPPQLTTNADGDSTPTAFPASSQDPWVPRSAAQASSSMQITASAVNALRESGALRASEAATMPASLAAGRQKMPETETKKTKDKSKKPDQQYRRPVLPSSLNGLATLALDGDGGDVEAVSPEGEPGTFLPRSTVIVPLADNGDAEAAAATALSASAVFEGDSDDKESSSSLEIIIVAADAEVARSLSGTSAETQKGVRLLVRDAAAGRIAGQRKRKSDDDGDEEIGDDEESGSSSSSSSSRRPFLRRSPLPPLLPPRPPQLGGAGAGDAALRNAGARAARSEDLLVFLKPGVTLRRGYWRSVLSAAEGNPKAQFFFTGRRASPTLPEAEEGGGEGDWAKRLPWHNPFAFNKAFAIRRAAWVAAGGFSPAAPPGTDVEALLLSALDSPPRVEKVDAKGDLVKEENAGASGRGSIAPSGEPHGYLFAVQASKKRLAGVEGERDEDFFDGGAGARADEETKARESRSAASFPLFATSLALITAHHPLPPQHLIRAHSFLEDGVSGGGHDGGRDEALAKDVLRASAALAADGCPLSAGGDLLSGLVLSFASNWDEAGRAFQRAGACASSSVARVPSLAWQAGYLNDAVRRNVLEKCVRRSSAALEPGMPERPRREAAKADAAECVALLVGV